uniref:Uncharacterized protein n=1 Tax=Acrobeloides nanus TaxID=290746 RepID=A0A914CAX1_9BILA
MFISLAALVGFSFFAFIILSIILCCITHKAWKQVKKYQEEDKLLKQRIETRDLNTLEENEKKLKQMVASAVDKLHESLGTKDNKAFSINTMT